MEVPHRGSFLREVQKVPKDTLEKHDNKHCQSELVMEIRVGAIELCALVGSRDGTHTESEDHDNEEDGDGVGYDVDSVPSGVVAQISGWEERDREGDERCDTGERRYI